MGKLFTLCFIVVMCFTVVFADINIIFFCESDLSIVCGEIIGSILPIRIRRDSFKTNVTGTLVYTRDNYIENIEILQTLVNSDPKVAVLVGIGDNHVVNAIATVAKETNITAITYATSHHRKTIYSERVIATNPTHAQLGKAIDKVIGRRMLLKAYIICEDSLVNDGLLEVFKDYGVNISYYVSVSHAENDTYLRFKLLHMHDIGVRLIILHVTKDLFHRITALAQELSYFNSGYAWILTEETLPVRDKPTDDSIPQGLLAVEGHEDTLYEQILIWIIYTVKEELDRVISSAERYGLTPNDVAENFRQVVATNPDIYKDFSRGIKTNANLFEEDGGRRNVQFRLLNYVTDPEQPEVGWTTVGYVNGENLDMNTVIWPGESIFGPVSLAREFYTVVTRSAEPFVYIRGPVTLREDCTVNNVCLKIKTIDVTKIKDIIESFRIGEDTFTGNYSLYCCEGIVVDILHSLSVQLEFDFQLYFKEDDQYGDNINGSWTGMLGDVYHGAADIVAGAISITSERMSALSFTQAFYYSSFNMVAARERPYTTLWAFTRPFHIFIWILIIVSATTVAIATALYEWNSPFGLNPWGKKRKRNYTLGSALTMVYSLWFGHTVSTKSPKSWPSKVLQNFWAATAIFITAGYTANLAAFLAGNAYKDASFSILDAQMASKTAGVVETSAVEEYTKAINASLHTRFTQRYVNDIHEGITKIRSGELNFYMDDTPLLEHALSTYDANCTLKYATHSFGENSYAFGIRKGSWLKANFDPLILNFVELGVVEDLKWRYMGKTRQCENKLMSKDELGFGLAHTGGLFVMLMIGCGVAILLLIGEHLFYFLMLPKLRKKPRTSLWKNRNLEFFSQRLYRAINSEKVKHPAQALVSKVRQKRFEIKSQLHYKLHRQANSVPAALQSYQFTHQAFDTFQQMTFPYADFNSVHDHGESNGSVYTISGNHIQNSSHPEVHNRVNFQHAMSSPLLTTTNWKTKTQGFDNPVFESDEEDNDVVSMNYRPDIHSSSTPFERSYRRSLLNRNDSETSHAIGNSNSQSTSKFSKSVCVSYKVKDKRYETWPSPKTRKRSTKKRQNNYSKPLDSFNKGHPKDNKRIINAISIRDSKKKCRTCSLSSLDSYHGNQRLEVKDNRLKHNLRHHAMGTLPKSPSISLNEGAVEVLSKEDLLVLWKKSEIELQTKLNKMLHQNNHLRQLVNIAEESRQETRNRPSIPEEDQTNQQPALKCSKL